MAKLFKIETNKIVTAKYMFSAVDYNNNSLSSVLKSWSSDLSKLTDGSGMFYKCSNLETFYGDLGVITSGRHMFSGCSKLRSVSSTNPMFGQLLYGKEMFNGCSSLIAFEYNLGKLTEGDGMFSGCSSLSFFYGEMGSLTSGANMFENCYNLEKFSNDAGETHLAKLSNGYKMFYGCSSLTTFYGNLSSLTGGYEMFTDCKLDSDSVQQILTTIPPSVNNAELMLSMNESGCSKAVELMNLTSGTIPSVRTGSGLNVTYKGWNVFLTNGNGQDYVITNGSGNGSTDMSVYAIVEGGQYIPDASNWNNDVFVPNKLYEVITDVIDETAYSSNSGDTITFKYKGCTTVDEVKAVDPDYFTSDIVNGVWAQSLADLVDGNPTNQWNGGMFYNRTALTTFNSDLSSLTDGYHMFYYCKNLSEFNSDLSSLTDGTMMFDNCRLNSQSLKNIADTIATNNTNYAGLDIGIGNSWPTSEQKTYLTQIYNKRWNVYVNGSTYNPSYYSSILTLDEMGQEVETPIPYYAKPVPATKETARYIDGNGNYYNVLGGQFIYVSDPETYGMFTCLDDAVANMRLTKFIEEETI